ncbi:MAG: hypothetical protein KAS13_06235 [Candidatus Omnitrophica bacterium]|nr:hypothetical protein [Candidatus Omnitrophota bacterium]
MSRKRQKEIKISIGGIIIALTRDDTCYFKINTPYESFISQDPPEIHLKIHYCPGICSRTVLAKEIFNANDTWTLFKKNSNYILRTTSGDAIIDCEFKSGDIYLEAEENEQTGIFLTYPMDELLMINLLARERGVMFHACGLKYLGKGILFAGTSGAGKSTIANLWKKKKDAVILSDDRVIVRKIDSKFWIYGTPWHGDAKISSAEKAPLEKIFFLKHENKNHIEKINPIDAASRSIVRSFIPMWDKASMEFTLKFCSELSQNIPIYELGFLPDESIVDFITGKL